MLVLVTIGEVDGTSSGVWWAFLAVTAAYDMVSFLGVGVVEEECGEKERWSGVHDGESVEDVLELSLRMINQPQTFASSVVLAISWQRLESWRWPVIRASLIRLEGDEAEGR